MKLFSRIAAIILIPIVALWVSQGCSKPFSTEKPEDTNLSSGKPCEIPPDLDRSPETIEDVVAMINALPKPVTVACFVSALERPLRVSLTNNILSAQPADGSRSPRVFIMREPLLISIVPSGDGSKVVELSLLVSADSSIKGEIAFPVVNQLSPSAPYDKIRFNNGTTCGTCHQNEQRALDITFAEAYVSRAFQPKLTTLVDLNSFRMEYNRCNPQLEPERCAILQAIFGQGEVQSASFPSTMPFFF